MVEKNTRAEARPIRVFLLIETLNTGGTERQFTIAAKALREQFNVVLGCVSRQGALADAVETITEFDVGSSLLSAQAFSALHKLSRFLKEQRIQVAQSFDWYGNMLLIPAARMAGVPVVIGSHRQIGDVFSKKHQIAQAMMFRWADRVVCNCNAAAERLVQLHVPRKKLTVIANFVPEEVLMPAQPAFPRDVGKVRVAMVARMNNPVKNYPMLLRGTAQVAQDVPGLELLLAGDGPLRPELERLASQLGIANCVQFLGNRSDIPEIMSSVDIAVLTSNSEGLSNSILEAMAAGRPVIATATGGNVDLIKHGINGLLIPVGGESELVDALRTLATDPELRSRMGAEGKKRIVGEFRLESVVGKYRDLYLSLLNAKCGALQ